MKRGRLVILSGPSGVGKDTVIDAWKVADSRVERVVACTTREPRDHEVDGVDYTFLTVDEFQRRVADEFFLEYKAVYQNFYGTPVGRMNQILHEGRVAVLKIDVQGALSVMKLRPDALTVFLFPPSKEELRKRIESRGTDKPDVIARRLENLDNEIAQAHHYQHLIVNDSVDSVVQKLMELTSE